MKSIAETNRQKALLSLVADLNETVAKPIEVVKFCLKFKIDSSFFDALRDLDCITLQPVGIDEAMRFTRTARLLHITADEVLQAEKKVKRGKGKVTPLTTEPTKPNELTVDARDIVPSKAAEADLLDLAGGGKVGGGLIDAIEQAIKDSPPPTLAEVTAVPHSIAIQQCEDTRPAPSPSVYEAKGTFTDEVAITQRSVKVDPYGVDDMPPPHIQAEIDSEVQEPETTITQPPVVPLTSHTFRRLDGSEREATEKELELMAKNLPESTRLNADEATSYNWGKIDAILSDASRNNQRVFVKFDNENAPIPVLASNIDAAAYCVDVILAHCPDEPNDQTGLLGLIVDRLRIMQINQAHQLRDEVAPILSRAAAFEAATKVTF